MGIASCPAAAKDGCDGARAVACLGINNFISMVAAGLDMYNYGQIKMKATINGVTVGNWWAMVVLPSFDDGDTCGRHFPCWRRRLVLHEDLSR